METDYAIANKAISRNRGLVISLLKNEQQMTYKDILIRLGAKPSRSAQAAVSEFARKNGFRRSERSAKPVEETIEAINPINTALSKVQEAAIAVKALDNEALKASFVSIFTALI